MIEADILRQVAEGEEPRVCFMPAPVTANPIGDRSHAVNKGARTRT